MPSRWVRSASAAASRRTALVGSPRSSRARSPPDTGDAGLVITRVAAPRLCRSRAQAPTRSARLNATAPRLYRIDAAHRRSPLSRFRELARYRSVAASWSPRSQATSAMLDAAHAAARVILGIELRQALLVARLGARVVTLVPREDPELPAGPRHRRRRRTPPGHERLFEKDPGCPVVAAEPVQVPDRRAPRPVGACPAR